MTTKLGILLSGAGSTYANIVAYIQDKELDAEIAVVVSSRDGTVGLQRANDWGHPTAISADQGEIQGILETHNCDLVAMCGFMRRYDPQGALKGKVLNVHPSLLPAFGGQGYYGDRVHKAVLEKGVRISGCSVHLVAGDYDTGPILAQRPVPVLPNDDVDSLRERVQAAERHIYPLVIHSLIASPAYPAQHEGRLAKVPNCDEWDLGFS